MQVIDKTSGKVKVTVTDSQVIIDLNTETTRLSEVVPGGTFKKNGVEYIVLEQSSDTNAVLRKEILKRMEYGKNNNWAESDVRKYLNSEYLNELEDAFGANNIVAHTVNLLSMDGLDDYGKTNDKASLLTIDLYRKYRKQIGKNAGSWWWLSTPDSTPSGAGANYVRGVDSDGNVDCGDYYYDGGVRPFCILKSNIFVSCED